MQKYQIILVAFSCFLVLGMSFLPKSIIKQNEKKITSTPIAPNSISTDLNGDFSHDSFKNQKAEIVPIINSILTKVSSASSNKIKASLIDSISIVYNSIGFSDSSARYAELSYKLLPNSKRLAQVANLYYNAFSFSISGDASVIYAKKASDYLSKIMIADPKDLDTKAKYAMTLVVSAPMQGVGILKEILKDNPSHKLTLQNLGMLSMQSGQYDKAIDHFTNLLKNHPSSVEGKYYLGLCYYQTGEKEKSTPLLLEVQKTSKDPALVQSAGALLNELN